MMQFLQKLTLFGSLFILFQACSSGQFQKTKSGLIYQVLKKGKGEKLKGGDYIKFHVKVFQKDSMSYNSFGKIPVFVGVDSVGRPYDITEVLPLLHVGDSVIVIQSVDTIAKLQGGQMLPGFKRGDKIKIYLRIDERYTDMGQAQTAFNNELESQKKREITEVENYLKDKKIAAVKTSQGVYVETIRAGSMPLPDSGKQVMVKYTGSNFKGKKFDSNVDPSFGHLDTFKITIGQMGAIPGFEDGVKQIGKGGKAKIYIPSMLGYGMQGSPPAIQPFENLIFEVEVLDIVQAPAPKPTPAIEIPAPEQKPSSGTDSGKK